MSRTLNQLIEAAVLGGEEAEEAAPKSVEVQQEKIASVSSSEDFGDVEKIASALEFLGRKGVSSFLDKKAAEHGGDHGSVGTNMNEKPGLPAPAMGVDTGSAESGSHVPQLNSNESAIAYNKKVKAQRTSAALSQILDNTPFSDSSLKHHLSNADAKGDKNIHTKSAHDLSAVRAELERRAEERA